MVKLRHPNGRHLRYVNSYSLFWALLFGPLYYAAHGLWLHSALFTALCVLTMKLLPPLVLAVWVMYAAAVTTLLVKHYLAHGWTEEQT